VGNGANDARLLALRYPAIVNGRTDSIADIEWEDVALGLGRKGEDGGGGAAGVISEGEGEGELGHCRIDWMVLEKMLSLYESRSEWLYLPLHLLQHR